MVAPIPVTASDAAGFDYHLSVPSGTDLLFVASSGSFSMADAAGAAISPQAGLSQTINIPAGQSQYKQTITINRARTRPDESEATCDPPSYPQPSYYRFER
jgi:hypothetical protein